MTAMEKGKARTRTGPRAIRFSPGESGVSTPCHAKTPGSPSGSVTVPATRPPSKRRKSPPGGIAASAGASQAARSIGERGSTPVLPRDSRSGRITRRTSGTGGPLTPAGPSAADAPPATAREADKRQRTADSLLLATGSLTATKNE